MAANNAIGTVAPLAEIGAIARAHDAAQAYGHIPLDVQAMHIDLLSISAHKVYGPKGIGALYRRRSNPRVLLELLIYGGGHEKGIRSGTLNTPGIVGLGAAAVLARREMAAEDVRFRALTEEMLERLRAELGDVERNGHPTQRLLHTLNVYIPSVESRALIVQLPDVAIATGSACTSASVAPSHVIAALGFDETRAHGSMRIGVGRGTTDACIHQATGRITAATNHLRALAASHELLGGIA